jgi:putative aldouronate transport system permease protein
MAILLNEIRSRKFKRITQSTMLFPFFISWVIVSYMLQGLLGAETGLINRIIEGMGGVRVAFYNEPKYWYAILLILNVWKHIGYNSIIYLAVITGIDEGLFEAAHIEGANRVQRIRYITLPLLFPTICILTLMSIGRIFYGDFGMFYAIIRDNGSLMPMAEVIDTYVFRTFKITGNPSLSMAVGLYQSTIGFILVFVSNSLVKRYFPEGALF